MNTFEQIQAATAELRAENIRLQSSRIRWRLACLLLVVFALAASFAACTRNLNQTTKEIYADHVRTLRD